MFDFVHVNIFINIIYSCEDYILVELTLYKLELEKVTE